MHSTTRRLKHSTNFESVENVRSSNVVEFEFELCHISNDVIHLFTHSLAFPSLSSYTVNIMFSLALIFIAIHSVTLLPLQDFIYLMLQPLLSITIYVYQFFCCSFRKCNHCFTESQCVFLNKIKYV